MLNQRSARSIFQLSRREREFLIFNLAHRDETENFCHLISCFETRPRIISFNLRHRDEIENFHDLFSVFETRTRNFDIAISTQSTCIATSTGNLFATGLAFCLSTWKPYKILPDKAVCFQRCRLHEIDSQNDTN